MEHQTESTSTHDGGGFHLFEGPHSVARSLAERHERGEGPGPRGMAGVFHHLQRSVGNQVLQRSLAASRKSARDAEPDSGGSFILQPHCACGGTCAKCQERARLAAAAPARAVLQRKTPGRPLAPTVRADMEGRFGEDFSRVRVHTDGHARRSAKQFHADAYTVGRDIFFDGGKFDPHSYRGRRLLAHELTHVVQQDRAVRPPQASVALGHPGDRYEREAERISERVARPANLSAPGHAEPGKRAGGGLVEVRERWRGPEALLSRAPAEAKKEKGPTPMQAAGLSVAQVACIKRIFEQAAAVPKSDKWKRCYVTAKAAGCNLPSLEKIDSVRAALNEAITPAAWELYLADPKGVICASQGGQAPETCCEEAPPAKEKPKDDKGATAKK